MKTSVFAEIQGFACSTAGTSFNLKCSPINFAFSAFNLAFSSFSASSSPVLTFWQPTSPSHPSPGFTARSSSKCFNVVCGFSPGRISEKRRQIVMRTPRNNLPMNGSLPKATILKTYLRTKHAAIFVWKISTLSLLRLYLLAPLCGDLIGRLFK